MKLAILISQIIISIMLIIVIFLQSKGGGWQTNWNSNTNIFNSKRGTEKVIFIATIILAVIFLISSIINVFVSR